MSPASAARAMHFTPHMVGDYTFPPPGEHLAHDRRVARWTIAGAVAFAIFAVVLILIILK